jgi:hypothetical protein
MFVNAVTAIEFINRRYNPLDINTDNLTKSVCSNINSYDRVFERLYEKYGNYSLKPLEPESELITRLFVDILMKHLLNSQSIRYS